MSNATNTKTQAEEAIMKIHGLKQYREALVLIKNDACGLYTAGVQCHNEKEAQQDVEMLRALVDAVVQIAERAGNAKEFADPGSYNQNLGADVLKIIKSIPTNG